MLLLLHFFLYFYIKLSFILFLFYFGCSRLIIIGWSLFQVPFGMLVGEESFATLRSFYSGYGEMEAFGGRAPDQVARMTRMLERLF
jgi:hypothetical protein